MLVKSHVFWKKSYLIFGLTAFLFYVTFELGRTVVLNEEWQVLLLPVAGLGVATILLKPHCGLYLIPVSVLLLPTNVDKLPGPFFADSLVEYLLYSTSLGAAFWILRNRGRLYQSRISTFLNLALTVYVVSLLFQLLRPDEGLDAVRLVRGYLVPMLMYFLTITLVSSRQSLERLILISLGALFLHIVERLYFHLFFWVTFGHVFARYGIEGAEYQWMFDWALIGRDIVWLCDMTAPWALILGLAYPSRTIRFFGLVTAAAAALYSTTSTLRIGLVGTVSGMLGVLIASRNLSTQNRRKARLLAMVPLTVAAMVIPWAVDLELRTGSRLATYSWDWSSFLSSPFFGGGVNTSFYHSYWLAVLANWGLLVGVPVALFWSFLFAQRYVFWRRAECLSSKVIAAASFAAIFPMFADSLFDHTLAGLAYAFNFWLICGITTVAFRFAEAENAVPEARRSEGSKISADRRTLRPHLIFDRGQ